MSIVTDAATGQGMRTILDSPRAPLQSPFWDAPRGGLLAPTIPALMDLL